MFDLLLAVLLLGFIFVPCLAINWILRRELTDKIDPAISRAAIPIAIPSQPERARAA